MRGFMDGSSPCAILFIVQMRAPSGVCGNNDVTEEMSTAARRMAMALKPTEKIWHNGKLIRWEDATIHVLSHVVSYGSAVFEGLRCYDTKNGPAIFRVREHMQRMINSGKIYRIEWPFTADDLSNAAAELVRVNKMTSCYIRP